MEWAAFVVRTFFGADNVPIKCAAAKQACFLSFALLSSAIPTGAPDNSGTICHNPADDSGGTFFYNEVMPVKKCNDRVWCFFNADDVVRVDEHLLPVHTGQKYHKATKIMRISL
jgi:hypothetical protein